MKCIKVNAGERPQVVEIDDTLENLQNAVEGIIDEIYIDDEVAIILNDEGKILNLPINRALKNERGEVVDVICGNFLIVGAPADSDSFASLSDEQIEKYMAEYAEPLEEVDAYEPLSQPFMRIVPFEW